MNRYNLTFFLVVLLISWSVLASASSYSLNDCFQLAVSRSEVLADQQEQVTQAEEHYKQALAGLLPFVSGVVSYTKQDPHAAGNQADATTVKFTASYPLFHGFRLMGAVKQSESLLSAQKGARQEAMLQVYSDVSKVFYLVLSLQHDESLLKEEDSLYAKRLRELNDRVRIGRSRTTEVLTLKVAISQLKAQIEQVRLQIETAQSLLQFLTGQETTLVLNDSHSTTALQDLDNLKQLLVNRPDVKAASDKLESAKIGITLAVENEWLPQLDLNGNYYLQHPVPSTAIAWDATLALTLPNFIGSFNQSKVDEAKSIVRQAENAKELLVRSIVQNIEDNYKTLKSEQTQINILKETVSLSDQNAKTVADDYRYGLSTNLDVLQALNSLADSKRALNKAQYAYQTDYAQLAVLTADVPIPEGLK